MSRPIAGHPPYPWYPEHPSHPSYRPGHGWRWATAGAITGWVAYRWSNPIYYSYGSGGTVYYENNVVYADDKQYASADEYYNESTGVTHPIEGMVDEETQRAAWKAVDGSNPDVVMETGLFNLTQDQAPVLVHFGPEEPQTALLVRLDESERPESGE
jgi:hypothetical protein